MEFTHAPALAEKPPGLVLHPLPPSRVLGRTQQSNILREELPFIPEKEEYQGKNAFLSPIDNDPEPREAEANFVEFGSDSTEGSESLEPMCFEERDVFLVRSPVSTPDSDRSSLKSCKLETFFSPMRSGKLGLDELSAGPPLLDLTRLMMQPLRPAPSPQLSTTPPSTHSDNQDSLGDKESQEDEEEEEGDIDTSCSSTHLITDNGVTISDTDRTASDNANIKNGVLSTSLLNQVTATVREKVKVGEVINNNSDSYSNSGEEQTSGSFDPDVNQNVTLADEPVKDDRTTVSEGNVLNDNSQKKPGEDKEDKPKRGKNRNRQGKKRKHETMASSEEAGRKEKKSRPNYFVAVQITNQRIKDNLGEVQQHIVQQQSLLSGALVPPPTLHLTLHVSHLANEEEINRVGKALDTCREELLSAWDGEPAPLLHIRRLGNFQHKVLFAKVEEDEGLKGLHNIADTVNSCLAREGIHSTDSRGFKPHLTIFKLSKDPSLFKKVGRIKPDLYKLYEDCDVGWQRVLGLQLCSMVDPKDSDGYYKVAHSVSFGLPEGEPSDGSAGRSSIFSPTGAPPLLVTEELVKELQWDFHTPSNPCDDQRSNQEKY